MEMKKYFMIFAAAMTVFAACQEEMTPEINTNVNEIIDYPVDITFVASNEAGTKTVINGEQITWESDDEIKVLWSNTGSNKAIAEPYNQNSCAQFTTKVEEADAYYAVHPYAATSSYVDGNIVVKVPSVQGGLFENANIAVAKATEEMAFNFRHLVGMIEFTTDTPGKVTISGAEGDVLTGTVTVTGFDANGYPQYSEDKVTGASNVIEIDVKASGTYYAAFLPSATLKCLSVKVEGKEATEYALSPNQLQMARGKIIGLGNIDTKFGKNLFVSASADGNGDGKTWETALTYQQMANMVAAVNPAGPDAPSGDTNTALDSADPAYLTWHNGERAADLDGITFHIAEGTYKTSNYVRISFPGRETPVKLSFKGGYSSESKGTDLSKRFVNAEDVTTVTGEQKRRHFFVRYSSNVTFDGITFTEGAANGYNGGSILFSESSTSKLTVNACKFISNDAGQSRGGAVYGQGQVGVAVFNDCKFTSNSGQKGGAVTANTGQFEFNDCEFSENSGGDASGHQGGALNFTKVSLICKNCDFTRNKSYDNGGAVWLSGMTKAEFTDCDFIANSTDNLAGAICLSGANPLTVTRGIFSGNSAVKGGGCLYNNAASTINITGTKFADNKTDAVGGVFQCNANAGPVINIKDAEFSGNTANKEGGAIYFLNGKWTVTNTAFKNNKAVSNGGAIYANTGSITIQQNSLFEGNETTAGSVGGGAVYVTTNATISVAGSTFRSNKANGSYKDGTTTVYRKGGAIGISNSAGTANVINSSTFVSNESGLGGGVYVSDKQLDMSDCSFKMNTTSYRGGAVCGEGANLRLRIDKTHFSANASVQGAAVRITNGVLYMNASTVTDNKPSNNNTGGVLYLEKTSFINNCCFYDNDNSAAEWVSDIVLNGAASTILNSTIVEKDSNVTGIRTYNTSDSAPTNLYNNTILCGHENVGAGWGNILGSVTSCGYNYTGPWVVKYTGTTAGAVAQTLDSDNIKSPSAEFNNFTLTNNADGRNWYTWTKPTDVAGTTAADVTAFLNGITGGSDFATWLGTVDGLTKDIAGKSRPATGWYPGCYQGN